MSDQLPIFEIIPDVRRELIKSNTLILQAPPGAGKSTILPIQLLNEPWLNAKKILMLEPRRLAARAVAQRMSSLLNEAIGNTIGYRIRFENKISDKTHIEVLTEGILTRMLQSDNSLEGAGLVIFDEFHERSLHADLALALCREAQQVLRNDLRIIIMSATLDGEKLSSLLENAPVITSAGRQHPIKYHYLDYKDELPIAAQVAKTIRKALAENKGDILTFLPGAGEIEQTYKLLEAESQDVKIHLLYGDLPHQQQQEAILPHPEGRRKVVLATSIAETSLTIEGITTVVDSGYSRVPKFNPRIGLTRLETMRVSKDTADQRAGRAGRLGLGVCYRLWSEYTHQNLQTHRNPEIMEADLAPAVLELSQWGVRNFEELTWLTSPPHASVTQAKELLRQLGALQGDAITERGKKMLRFPTHPRIAHLLLEAEEHKLSGLATDIAALLEERDPLAKEVGANLTLRIETLRKWRNKEYTAADRKALERIERVAASWRKVLKVEAANTMPVDEEVGKLVADAYPERIAKKIDNLRYRLVNGRVAKLNEYDPLANENWLSIAHMDAGKNEGRIFLAAPLNPADVLPLATQKKVISWDSQKGILITRSEKRLGEIIIETTPLEKIPNEELTDVLCEVVKKEGLSLFNLTDNINEWQARVMSLKKWRPEENWPDVTNEYLRETVNEWFPPYLAGVNIRKKEDFFKIDLYDILQQMLSWEFMQKLDKLAPQKIEVPSGTLINLKYNTDGSPPVLAVRLQEVFGLLDTPAVNEGKIKVMMHLLSPGYKPVQVTQDLKSFWKNTYPEVRKELRMRYPKHSWPEDPWTAVAVKGAKKRANI